MHNWLRRLIMRRPLPIPTAEQTESFAEYVVGAHSWYKHLPCNPPGAPFVVFLDPNAGSDLGAAGFHYSWMPRAEYLAKFGHWHYVTDRGTRVIVQPPGNDHGEVRHHDLARISATNGASIVSPEVFAAGTVHLTVHIHELFDARCVYALAYRARKFREKHGAEDPSYDLDIIDLFDRHKDDLPGLDRQIEAERARQRAELRGALHRVRTLLAPGEGR